jgi:hypothetical protein
MQNILGTSGAISRPAGTPHLWWKFPGTACQATLIGVPSSFVSPFHEKTGRQIDYGGQAGTNLCEQNLPFGSQANAYGASPSRLS